MTKDVRKRPMARASSSRIAACTIALVLLAAVSLFAPPRSHAVERLEDGTVRIRAVRLNYLSYAPLLLAESQGHFAEQGVEIEWVPIRRAAEGLLPLSQGKIDVLPNIVYPGLFNLIARGAGIRIVADKGHVSADTSACSYMSYVARTEIVRSGRLETAADIRGLRFATSRTRAGYYEASRLLELAGLKPDDIVFANVPQNVLLQALESGSVDVTLLGEPHLSKAAADGYVVEWMPLREIVPDHQHSYLLFGPTLLEDDRAAGEAFMRAYRNALVRYNEGATPENIAAVAEATTLEPSFVAGLCWAPVRTSGRINTEDLVQYQEWARGEGLLDEVVSPARFWDGSFLDHADSVLAGGSGK